MTRADGLVDPLDPAEVAPVLAGVLATMGAEGVGDLLARLPGVRHQDGVTAGFLRRATPSLLWLGPEDAIVLLPVLEHHQVVGGVVLHRDPLEAGDLPGVLANLIARSTASHQRIDEAAVALSGARDAIAGF